jgi:hypothetical protein
MTAVQQTLNTRNMEEMPWNVITNLLTQRQKVTVEGAEAWEVQTVGGAMPGTHATGQRGAGREAAGLDVKSDKDDVIKEGDA